MTARSFWNDRILPHLIERVCRSRDVRQRRELLVPRAHGEVLEIGVGSGLNLPHYDAARTRRLVAIDPSPTLLERARTRLRVEEIPTELVEAPAEALPFADAAFDSVVMTYTLCSVDDKRRALAEIRRVLRPGGALYFLEHGRAPEPRVAAWQRRLNPFWRTISGGCRLDGAVLEELGEAGFTVEEIVQGYGDGARWLSYLYRGVARRAET